MTTAVLHIRDEVNVKIEGLDLTTRKNLVNKFKYDIPYARYLPAVRLGRWDGKVSFFQLGGSTFVNLLSEIIPELESAGYDLELNDLRDYRTSFDFDEVSALVNNGLKVHDTTMQSDVLKIIHGLNAMVWSSTGC